MLKQLFLLLGACTVGLFSLTATMPNTTPPATPTGVKNIVLVHGAFADGSSWSKVIPLLQAKGYHVVAVQNPLTSLADDVAATKRAIELQDGPVLLVGHSYGGVVITEAGNDPKVAGLLYVAANAPDAGQSLAETVKLFAAPLGSAAYKPDAHGFLNLTPEGARHDFAPDLTPTESAGVFATQGPWAVAATTDKVTKAAWHTKPTWSIVAAHDRIINPDLERAQAKQMKATTLELSSSHVAMLSHPAEVADFIHKAAQQVAAK